MDNARVSTLRGGVGEAEFVGGGVAASDMPQSVPVLNMPLGVSVLDALWRGSCDGSGDVDGGESWRVAASSSSSATFGGHRPRSSASRTELGSSSSDDIRNPEGGPRTTARVEARSFSAISLRIRTKMLSHRTKEVRNWVNARRTHTSRST